MNENTVRESLLQEIAGNKVHCNVCERRCLIVSGGRGWCRIRENRAGQLVTLIYGAVSTMAANPIEKKLYNTFVTNGYMTEEALFLLVEAGLDAMNIDVKGDAAAMAKYCKGVNVEKVWDACKLASSRGAHVEVTTLVVPTVNDSDSTLRGIADRIVADLGADTPGR